MITKGNITEKDALFVESPSKSQNENTEDPALLSVSQRRALFEKNRGTPLVPLAAFGMATPVKDEALMKTRINACKIEDKPNLLESKSLNVMQPNVVLSKPVDDARGHLIKSKKYPAPKPPIDNHQTQENNSVTIATVHQIDGTPQKMAIISEIKSKLSQNQSENKGNNENDKLLNRFDKYEEVTQEQDLIEELVSDYEINDDAEETAMITTERSIQIIPNGRIPEEKRKSFDKLHCIGDSPLVAASDKVKRMKFQPKDGKLYSSLSNIEASTETEVSNESNIQPEDSRCDKIIDWILFCFCLA